MSSLAGGAADKLGNRYELWWTVSELVRMLHGKSESIRIEDPGLTKAEFVVVSAGRRVLHQAKRSHPNGKWSLTSLASSDVQLLQGMFTELLGNDARFVFVSGSQAEELDTLAERAQQAASFEEFETTFIGGKKQRDSFDRLRQYWNNADAATAYGLLQRIEVRTISEPDLEEKVKWALPALFLADSDAVASELRCIALDSVHKTITRDELIARLVKRGYTLRRLQRAAEAAALVKRVTEGYIAGVRSRFIRKRLIPRSATQLLLKRIETDGGGSDCVLTGKAGAGKTGCVAELVEAGQERGMAILAFRLDRLNPVTTTCALGGELELEESPALVLQAAAGRREALLVIDQLDAVSTVSGRGVEFLEAVDGLLAEVRGLREQQRMHVVVVCRTFDWENDHRLRRLLSEKHTKVEVSELSADEAKGVLAAEGFRVELFQPWQIELLRLPQNLSLFLEASFDPGQTPQFNMAKELFDLYWNEKRHRVAKRAAPSPDQWSEVIHLLCEEMTRTQQLSVMREVLDPYEAYAVMMASEGVLTFDGQRYGFMHESFFDYCFARAFVTAKQPLTDFLTASEQHLFRRAQVRQVLSYLRDADQPRYCRELRALLTDGRIRPHLKDLALALAVGVPDPGDDDWNVLEPWLSSELAALAQGRKNEDRLASLVWRHFFTSETWFHFADKRGLLTGWLESGVEAVINMGVHYIRWHQRHSPDKVAELLEPYVGRPGEWPARLRYVIQWADHGKSRRFFNLLLRLIDDGTLDDARGPIAVNSTFWSLFYGLGKVRPGWVAEIVAHWLRRRIALIRPQRNEHGRVPWGDLFNHDSFGQDELYESATNAPFEFIEHVLPVVLEIADAAVYEGKDKMPLRDCVWPFLMKTKHESIEAALITALTYAFTKCAETPEYDLSGVIDELQRRNTYIANLLLLSLYTSGAKRFADTAVSLLCREPWRFHCGYTDSPYWVAMELIRAVVPHCSAESRAKLEAVVLDFTPEHERSLQGYKHAGLARFSLLSCFGADHRSSEGQARFRELERKFEVPESAPQGMRTFWVGPPIKKEAADRMTDEQWLRAIAKYRSEDRPHRWEAPEKGGAWELASMLREFTKGEPERFARLCLGFPAGTHPVYIERTLEGLKGSAADIKLKLEVCRKAYIEAREECGKAIADLLGSIEDPLPDDAVQILGWLATEYPDPEPDGPDSADNATAAASGSDIYIRGINTTRGRAAEAIRDLIWQDAAYVERFRDIIDRLVEDRSVSVRSCVASVLYAVAAHDISLALQMFARLVVLDERVLGTPYTERFIDVGVRQHFAETRPYVERMLRSGERKVSEAGARLASLAVLYGGAAGDLVAEATSGSPAQRLGVAQVAAQNIGEADCRDWCEHQLLTLFNDTDADVRREAASCFRHLRKQPLETYEPLIEAFCDSPAYGEDSFSIFHLLEESVHRLPGITCEVTEKFLERFSEEAKDIRTHRAGEVHTVATLVFRTYQQHQGDEWASRCLDLIDRMCLEGIHDVKTGLDEFER